MNIVAVGIDHKAASIEVREKFYLQNLERELLISELKQNPSILEGFVLSTCNRTEIYAHVMNPEDDADRLIELLFAVKNIKMTPELKRYFCRYFGEDAIRHLFRVTTGVESLILGEKQILGQVKLAIELARRKGMMAKTLNILSNVAVRTGKKAQHETEIGSKGTSISWAAVDMAEKVLGTLAGKSVLIIGAGKMSELAANRLESKGVKEIYVVNRTHEHAFALAERFNGKTVSFLEMGDILAEVDVCICSTGAPHYILDKNELNRIMGKRNNRLLILLDISMPRNIDPAVAELAATRLFTIDNLDKVVMDNIKRRESAVEQVEAIIARKIEEYRAKLEKNGSSGPIVKATIKETSHVVH